MSGNDGMAELMRTARMLKQELVASVRVVHHVSQNVARSNTWDQYAGRGGTAFADNSRSQHQIVRLTSRKFEHEGSNYTLPTDVPNGALGPATAACECWPSSPISSAIRCATPCR